ncbi:MAG: hypothetical protein ACLFP2_01895 [Candidatus Woesearchaeota archaeon]
MKNEELLMKEARVNYWEMNGRIKMQFDEEELENGGISDEEEVKPMKNEELLMQEARVNYWEMNGRIKMQFDEEELENGGISDEEELRLGDMYNWMQDNKGRIRIFGNMDTVIS